MKIAYLILAHKDPKHLARLIRSLSTPNTSFFIHIDQKSDLDDFNNLVSDNVFFTKERVPVYYDYSMVEAMLILHQTALMNMGGFDYFVRLNGVDYPIQPASYIESFFHKNMGKEFMEIMPIHSGDTEFPMRRLVKYELRQNASIGEKLFFNSLSNMGIKPNHIHKFLQFNLKPYWGSSLMALTRAACEYIRYFATINPKIMAYFKHTHYPDEMIFQIILGNSPYIENISTNLHFIDWSEQMTHPPELTEEHLLIFSSSLAVKSGKKEFLFANKFSSKNEDVVEHLDQIIREKEQAYLKSKGESENY
jgi:hypothetical protein